VTAPRSFREATEAYAATSARLTPHILTCATSHALATATAALIEAATAELQALRAEITVLKTATTYAPDALLEYAAAASLDVPPGSVLQATDSPRRLIRTAAGWEAAP
jgi:hypothetical protein